MGLNRRYSSSKFNKPVDFYFYAYSHICLECKSGKIIKFSSQLHRLEKDFF